MSKYCHVMTVFAAALLVVGLVSNVQADLLFSDIFDTDAVPAAGNGYCLNTDLSTRLGGTVGNTLKSGTAWNLANPTANEAPLCQVNMQTDTAYVDKLHMFRTASGGTGAQQCHGVLVNHDFADDTTQIATAGGFTIRFDADPTPIAFSTIASGSGPHSNFGKFGVGVGCSGPNGGGTTLAGYADTSMDFSMMIKDNGQAIIYQKGTYANPPAWFVLDQARYDEIAADPDNPNNFANEWTYELRITTQAFSNGTNAVADLYYSKTLGANSSDLIHADIDPTDKWGAGSMSWHFTWDADAKNYIEIWDATAQPNAGTVSYGVGSTFDNVMIGTGFNVVVPEPSTLAMLAAGLIGLLAYAWRKRK